MNALDYYNNPEITKYINRELAYISNREDREDCHQEIYAEIYSFMPLDLEESKRLIKRVCEKFKRGSKEIYDNETSINELPL